MAIPLIKDWEIVYEDSEIDIKLDPTEPEGYCVHIKGKSLNGYLLLPRGCLRDIALDDRDKAKRILENIMPYHLQEGMMFEGTGLTHDSFLAAITRAHILEEERLERRTRG